MNNYIGKVMATEKTPTTIDDFCFWTQRNLLLNPFDIVCVEHIEGSITYGIIEEISHITDSSSFLSNFLSNDFGNIESDGNSIRLGMNIVKAKVLGNTKDYYIPVHEGAKVRTANEEEITEALGLNCKGNPVVMGYLDMYSSDKKHHKTIPVHINYDYLIGPEGAHLNISGISGLAAKTSYAMFVLNALQQKEKEANTAYIFFNVKGNDLLSIDEKPEFFTPKEESSLSENYKKLGLDAVPFKNVKYFYPGANGDNVNSYLQGSPHLTKQITQNKAFAYKFTYEDYKNDLDLFFSNIDDSTQTMDSILSYIDTHSDFANTTSWENFLNIIENKTYAGQTSSNKEITVASWRKFSRITRKTLRYNALFPARLREDSRERSLSSSILSLRKGETMVIDMAKLPEDEQAFVFGCSMRALQDLMLTDKRDLEENNKAIAEYIPDRVVVFVDELNKYAANDLPKNSPIVRLLLDIAERGRSLGIILFSAEQFKSAIHDRIKGNCSTHAYGRTNAIEIAKQDYKFISPVYKNMMTRLKQGEYIVQNPLFRSVLKLHFPRPCYKQFK